MDINIELEVKAKAIEMYKKVLNKNNTRIVFNDHKSHDVIEKVTIKNGLHTFNFTKKYVNKERNRLNNKYEWLIPDSILKDNKLNNEQRNSKILKLKYLKIFKHFYGGIILSDIIKGIKHNMNYNGVVYNIKDTDYSKYFFYSEYAYKIYQLRKLNKDMGIEQNITLYFDENVFSNNMYDKFYNILKDVL